MAECVWNEMFLNKLDSKEPHEVLKSLREYLSMRLVQILNEKVDREERNRDISVEEVSITRLADKVTIAFSLVEGLRRVEHKKEWTDAYLMSEPRPITLLIERELRQALKEIPPGQREDELQIKWPKLNRGTLVIAMKHLDADGANVPLGMLGVVFQEAEYHEVNTGPMVRWMNGGACSIYDGWVCEMRG